jgi:hypothetical protein
MISRYEAASLIRERLDPHHHSLIQEEHVEAAVAAGREFRVLVLCRDRGSLLSVDELSDEWRQIEDFLCESSASLGTTAEKDGRARQAEIMAAQAVDLQITPGTSSR